MYSILVVDDSYTTRQIEKSILEMENYTIDTAENGIDALNKMKKTYYNLIIFDIKMPQMDGFSLVRNMMDSEWRLGLYLICLLKRLLFPG